MKQIVIFASGSGSTFEYLVQHAADVYSVAGMFCDRAHAGVISRARRLNVPYYIVDNRNKWQKSLDQLQPDLIVLAGYLKLLPHDIVSRFQVINTHPALLPSYGGKGFYGDRVHQAVLHAGETVSGVTIHRVDREYDRGEILVQQSVPVHPDDTVIRLAGRVQAVEKPLLFETIKQLLEAQ